MVKTGNVGLVVNHYTGMIDGRVRHAGYNAQPPFSGKELIEIPTYERTYTMVRDSGEGAHAGDDSVMVNTASSNTLHADVSVTYHIVYDPAHDDEIVRLYNKYRTQFQGSGFGAFEETQLRPLFRNAVSDAFGKESTLEAMTGDGKRRAAAHRRQKAQRAALPPIRSRSTRSASAPSIPTNRRKTTLQTHLEAEQNLRLATLNQQLNDLTNQRDIARATAEAQAARLRAASLTPRLVKFRHLDSINIVGVARGTMVSIPGTNSTPEATESGTPPPAKPR